MMRQRCLRLAGLVTRLVTQGRTGLDATQAAGVVARFPGPGSEAGFLSVDVGGSGIRAGFFDVHGTLRHLVTRPDLVDGSHFDAEVTWRAVASAVRELTELGITVAAVGVSAHLATVLVSPAGQTVDRAILWRDNSARHEALELGAEFGAMLPAVTGRPPNGESTAARMRMLSRSNPELLARTRWILSLKDFLVLRLTGTACTDPASASYTQLFDVRRREWSGRLVDACGVPGEALPPVMFCGSVAGPVIASAAELTGVQVGTPVAVGGPDGSIGVLGAGACRSGITVDIAGTTDVLLHVTSAPPEVLRGGVILNANLLDGLWAIGGPTGMTGGGLAWLTAILGYPSVGAAYEALGGELAVADPGDLMIQTVLTGRRFPGWNSSLRGRIDGISAEHGPGHLLRAAEEGSVFEVRLGLDAIRATGVTIDGVITAGMRATTERTMQLRADVLGAPVGTTHDAHASLRGAAIAAGLAAGVFGDAEEASAMMTAAPRWYHPVRASAVRAEQRYQRWRAVMAEPSTGFLSCPVSSSAPIARHRGPVQQPLGPVRSPSPACRAIVHPLRFRLTSLFLTQT